ncbi:MAG: PA2779 family protein [candidate division WOR-3 bacterium]
MLKRCIAWYLVIALCIMGFVPPLEASFLPSDALPSGSTRTADLDTIRKVLETRLIQQRLLDLGFTSEEVSGRIAQLSDTEIHQLAQRIDELRVGRDGWSVFFGILAVAALVIIIYYLLTHRVIIQ